MSLFGPSTRHLVLNSQNSCLGSEAVHRTQHKLHLLDPDIFPLLRDASVPAVWNSHPPLPKTNSPVRLKGLEELKNKVSWYRQILKKWQFSNQDTFCQLIVIFGLSELLYMYLIGLCFKQKNWLRVTIELDGYVSNICNSNSLYQRRIHDTYRVVFSSV